ncbi:MCE family protein [Mycobacterium sp. smrl_JER01]|uniref:MCE family protein n=1 Tax=Mycobacterium sp. smrl_JER01 TaxID=3402633 RepID=UPI003ACF2E01
MKSFAERDPIIVGVVGVAITIGVVIGSLNYGKLPFVSGNRSYSAYFAEAGGLLTGAAVQVAGFKAGEVTDIALDGPRVLVTFDVDKNIRLGVRTDAAIKTRSILGAKVLELTPRGDGTMSGPIPLDRTTSPYQLPDALGDLTATISQLDTERLSDSWQVMADEFSQTAPAVRSALQGVARFSRTLNDRDAQLRKLLTDADTVTRLLADRSDAIVTMLADSDALLTDLMSQSQALDEISGTIATVGRQIEEAVAENRQTLAPALDKLNQLLMIVDDRKERIRLAIKGFNQYAMSLGESMSSGPFFKFYIANLLPGQFIQPFVDAAFSDLGLDPAVLTPAQLTDPQVGQPGTPALPVPFPRTGQGGDPRLTVPDAITGIPDDARYPYREPVPAPMPGGPPPGPPADPSPTPAPTPVLVPGPPVDGGDR